MRIPPPSDPESLEGYRVAHGRIAPQPTEASRKRWAVLCPGPSLSEVPEAVWAGTLPEAHVIAVGRALLLPGIERAGKLIWACADPPPTALHTELRPALETLSPTLLCRVTDVADWVHWTGESLALEAWSLVLRPPDAIATQPDLLPMWSPKSVYLALQGALSECEPPANIVTFGLDLEGQSDFHPASGDAVGPAMSATQAENRWRDEAMVLGMLALEAARYGVRISRWQNARTR